MKDWAELMQREEDLLPELQEYYEEGDNWPMIRHPLLFSVPHTPQQNAMCNERYRRVSQAASKALDTVGGLSQYIVLHERPYRLQAFLKFTAVHDIHTINPSAY